VATGQQPKKKNKLHGRKKPSGKHPPNRGLVNSRSGKGRRTTVSPRQGTGKKKKQKTTSRRSQKQGAWDKGFGILESKSKRRENREKGRSSPMGCYLPRTKPKKQKKKKKKRKKNKRLTTAKRKKCVGVPRGKRVNLQLTKKR